MPELAPRPDATFPVAFALDSTRAPSPIGRWSERRTPERSGAGISDKPIGNEPTRFGHFSRSPEQSRSDTAPQRRSGIAPVASQKPRSAAVSALRPHPAARRTGRCPDALLPTTVVFQEEFLQRSG